MQHEQSVSSHYTHGRLVEAIRAGLEALGRRPDEIGVDDLAAVDEFHIGGRAASRAFLDQLAPAAGDHVLDVGCGLGGASRLVAHRYGSRVTGIDLTPEYVEAGQALCTWVGLSERVTLDEGSATDLPYPDDAFDKAFMMHVGMNIVDKAGVMAGLRRVLRPGARVGIYDVMRTGEGDLAFPVPWATSPAESAVASPGEYKDLLADAGFRLVAERNRRDFALEFFAELRARTSAAGGPPPLGLHILMGETVGAKIKNMVANVSGGLIAPVELIAELP